MTETDHPPAQPGAESGPQSGPPSDSPPDPPLDPPLSPRQHWILGHIQDRGFATIEAMAEAIGVSAQTVRRDLIALEARNYLIRFHGGAGLNRALFRIGYAQKRSTGLAGKQRIAAAVAAMIPAGAAVYLDVGSTVECVARALLARAPRAQGPLHVVTPSAAVAMILAGAALVETFVTGGNLRGANGALTGDHALRSLQAFRFDFAISSFGGFDAEGRPTDFDPEKLALRRCAFENAARRIGAVDASKFDKRAMRRMEGPPLTELVVDAPPPARIAAALVRAGGRLVVAGAGGPRPGAGAESPGAAGTESPGGAEAAAPGVAGSEAPGAGTPSEIANQEIAAPDA